MAASIILSITVKLPMTVYHLKQHTIYIKEARTKD